MAKQSYKIPATLADGYASMDISLSTRDGSIAKMISLKVLGVWAASIIAFFYVLTHTFLSAGSVVQKVLFGLIWLIWTFTLAKTDATGRMQAALIPTLINYIPRKARYVFTRRGNKANDFWNIAGIKSIEKGGLIVYNDGTYGYMYRVVGSASILLFDADKNAILNRVDSFYRKISHEVEIIFMTAKESQKIYYQLAHLKKTYDNLETRDADLLELMEEQFSILKDEVGGSFKSIHQYMVLKGDNREALQTAKGVLQSEVENSSLMIKQCVALTKEEDIEEVLNSIYTKGV